MEKKAKYTYEKKLTAAEDYLSERKSALEIVRELEMEFEDPFMGRKN